MQNLLDSTPIAQFAIDIDHRVTHWNRALEKLSGIPAKRMVGTRDHWQPFYPQKRPVMADLIVDNNLVELKRLYKDRGVSRSDIIPSAWEATDFFNNFGGKDRHFYFLAAPIMDSDGNLIGAIETVQDITRRVLAENELRESQERYRILTEQVADGVGLILEGKLSFVNNAFAEIFGYESPKELAGRKVANLITDQDKPLYQEINADFDAGRFNDKNLELRCIRADSSEFWIEAHNNVITWNGTPALLATVRDISERKHRELVGKEEAHKLRSENVRLKSKLKDRYGLGQIVGRSLPMQAVYKNVIKAASSNANVIVYGESGTGKELVARAIHEMSDRGDKEFIAVNCGAIPESLIESEFFGHKKGAFTGATIDKIGFLESARGGYLFLDEVGEIPLNMQVKLLRVIEDGGFTPIGSTRVKKSDTRIIAATNRDLKDLVKKGLMRQDFFYRIHIIPIQVPPLRDRLDDLALLVYHFLDTFSKKQEDAILPEKVLKTMLAYDWPGNVRELQNVIQRYVTFKTLDFLKVTQPVSDADNPFDPTFTPEIGVDFKLRRVLEGFERRILLKAMRLEKGNRTRAALALGTERRSLQRKLQKYQIA
ncbi:MAG: PAS domain S-box protein [Desulfobacterales bacterium]|nr:PAS domain S-box protein [Desulfobacterales bacterium]